MIENLKAAHKFSFKNRNSLSDGQCGCFQCLKVFDAKEIKDWCDDGDTALCPYCGMDSVLSEKDCSIENNFLKKMEEHWFSAF